MPDAVTVRSIQRDDLAQWRPLWDGYNAFYGREGDTALDEAITRQTWDRFFVATDPIKAFVAEADGQVLGLVHIVYHPSTSRLRDICYLQDLFTLPSARGLGIGRALIEKVYAEAAKAGCSRVYWTTFDHNHIARRLYDKMATHNGVLVYTREMLA